MKKLLLTITFAALFAGLAQAQPAGDPRVADLVQAGKIRVGVHSIMYTNDPRTGELKGASTGRASAGVVSSRNSLTLISTQPRTLASAPSRAGRSRVSQPSTSAAPSTVP